MSEYRVDYRGGHGVYARGEWSEWMRVCYPLMAAAIADRLVAEGYEARVVELDADGLDLSPEGQEAFRRESQAYAARVDAEADEMNAVDEAGLEAYCRGIACEECADVGDVGGCRSCGKRK